MGNIDLEKAYDRLTWTFIKKVLTEICPDERWINMNLQCVKAESMQLVWNRELTRDICSGRCIRKGGPLSFYSFVLCIKKLSHIIQEKVLLGNWKTLKLSRNGLCISHLMFADDLIIFSRASNGQVKLVLKCLEVFYSLP